MIQTDEDALICDLAETYQIYDYRQLPAYQVAVFSYGLRDDSRIKKLMSDQIVSLDTLLLSLMVDKLSLSLWLQTKDGQKGINQPKSIASQFIHKEEKEEDRDYLVFQSGEEFERCYKERLASLGGDD